MSLAKASVRDADVASKTVLERVDLNVPLRDGAVEDDSRIRAAIPTIELLRERGAAIVLISHLGRPDGPDPELSMRPVGERLGELLGAPVSQAPEVVGDVANRMAEDLGPGELLLLENSRFEPGETKNDPALAQALASLADIYVDDAFGVAHRAHASTVGVAERLPGYAGLLLEREISELSGLIRDAERPLLILLGGAKVTDKVAVIERFLELADEILIGGAMCFSFFRAMGLETGDSRVEEAGVELARQALEAARSAPAEIRLPRDLVLGDRFAADAERREVTGGEVPAGWMGLDIGAETAAEYAGSIRGAASVFWNGPMGAFELPPFAAGTRTIAEAMAESEATTVAGGGDSVAALDRYGLSGQIDWVSTGGGASLALLGGKELPAVDALLDAKELKGA